MALLAQKPQPLAISGLTQRGTALFLRDFLQGLLHLFRKLRCLSLHHLCLSLKCTPSPPDQFCFRPSLNLITESKSLNKPCPSDSILIKSCVSSHKFENAQWLKCLNVFSIGPSPSLYSSIEPSTTKIKTKSRAKINLEMIHEFI